MYHKFTSFCIIRNFLLYIAIVSLYTIDRKIANFMAEKRSLMDYFDISTCAVSGGCLQTHSGPYLFERHIHNSFEAYLITQGNCSMNINGEEITCQKDDFIMILPNTVHSFEVAENEKCEFLHVHFEPELFAHILVKKTSEFSISLSDALSFHSNFYYKQTSNVTLFNLMTSIVSVYQKPHSYSAISNNLYVAQLMLYVLEQVSKDEPLTPGVHIQNRYISYTLQYIAEHFQEKILIPDIAKKLNISTRYLGKLFSQHMNLTLANYINIYRINQAIQLMSSTDMSLVDIALSIGLNDAQHFSRLFYKIINMPPGKYRKMIEKKL